MRIQKDISKQFQLIEVNQFSIVVSMLILHINSCERDKQLCNDKLLEFIKDNISEGNDINHKYNITGVQIV